MKAIEIEVEKEGEDDEPEEHEIRCWYEDIRRAEEIKADEKKMALVRAYAAKQKGLIDKITGGKTEVKDLASLKKRQQEEA